MNAVTHPRPSPGQKTPQASGKHCNYGGKSRIGGNAIPFNRERVDVPEDLVSLEARQALNTLRAEFEAVRHDERRSEVLRHEILEIAGRPSGLSPPQRPSKIFADLSTTPLEFYLDRKNPHETPPDFVRRVYGTFLPRSLLLQPGRDKPLYNALAKWMRDGKPIPPDLDLPTKKELNDRQLEALGVSEPHVSIRSVPSGDIRESSRLNNAARGRFG